MNADLNLKGERMTQPEIRVKTTIGGYRSTSPNLYNKDGSAKPITSPKGSRSKHTLKGNYLNLINIEHHLNRYHAMIDEAMKMTTGGISHSSQYLFAVSKFNSSEKGMKK